MKATDGKRAAAPGGAASSGLRWILSAVAISALLLVGIGRQQIQQTGPQVASVPCIQAGDDPFGHPLQRRGQFQFAQLMSQVVVQRLWPIDDVGDGIVFAI